MKEDLILTKTGLVDNKAMASAATSSGAASVNVENVANSLTQDRGTTSKTTSDAEHPLKVRRKSSLLASLNSALKSKSKHRKYAKDVELVGENAKSIDIVLSDVRSPVDASLGDGERELEMQPAYELKAGVGVQYCP